MEDQLCQEDWEIALHFFKKILQVNETVRFVLSAKAYASLQIEQEGQQKKLKFHMLACSGYHQCVELCR